MKAMVLEDFHRPLVWQQLRPCNHLSHTGMWFLRRLSNGRRKSLPDRSSHRLNPVVSERFPLEQAHEAMTVLRENSPLGPIVLQ
jgi:hypothetical protein